MYKIIVAIIFLTPCIAYSADTDLPVGLQNLLKAYPDHIGSISSNTLHWKDGTAMAYDDGIAKDFNARLNAADLEDQMSVSYPKGINYPIPAKDADPGRIRYELFFRKMYGDSPKAVRSKLVSIRWMPKTVNKKIRISSVNNVDRHLEAVSEELDDLPKELKKYVRKISGTFRWRNVAGTRRLSLHSFGIAIDIDRKYSDYWQWKNPNPNSDQKYKNRIPIQIVGIFEKHGFIWGGKWYHYDTMHFEYRPELLK